MNKKKSLTIIIVILIASICASTYILLGNFFQSETITIPSGTPPQATLKISGQVEIERTLTTTDLLQFPLKRVVHVIDGETANYLGITITDLLNKTGASWGAGFISIITGDTFELTIDAYQAYNSTLYEGSEAILAFAKNGQWINNNKEGSFIFIAPDLDPKSYVMKVSEINLQPWIITVNGKVNHPLVFTANDMADFEVKTVQATYAPGSGPQRTSNWTGITLSSILQVTGISSDAKIVTVVGIDGYSIQYTIEQVDNLDIMLCYQENGVPLSYTTSQPYRLIVPIEDFKWAQFWVKWVSEITVS